MAALSGAPGAGRKAGRPSIRDVASLAGVSVGTVSNTLNKPETVRPNKREAVESAIAELGFVPNQQARILSGTSSNLIGLVVQDIVSPFFMGVAHAVERVAYDADLIVSLASSENSPEKERHILEILSAQQARGALVIPAAGGPDQHDRLNAGGREPARDVPTVFLDYDMGPDHCSVSVDHVAGAQIATKHLLDLGHRSFAFVGDPGMLHQFSGRLKGVKTALLEAGLDPKEALVQISPPALGMADGHLAADELLARGLPSAVVCGNDLMAFGLYRGLTSAGIDVESEVALVGYDDIEFAADWVLPLTSVRQPTAELGKRAAELLLEHTSGDPEHRHRQIVLQPELIVRRSSMGPPRGPSPIE